MSLSEYTVGDKALWQAGRRYEQERLEKRINDIINSVIDYGLQDGTYQRVTKNLLDIIYDKESE